MPVLQINYDLQKHKDYSGLIKAIKDLGSWCHALESCWLAYTPLSAIKVRDRLLQAVDNDDKLLVTTVAVSESAGWYNLNADISQWLKKFLAAAYA